MNHLYVCSICQVEIEALAKRRRIEIDTFIKVGMGSIWKQGKGQEWQMETWKTPACFPEHDLQYGQEIGWGFPSAERQLGRENAVQTESVKPSFSHACSGEQEQGVRRELHGVLLENGKAALQLMED